MHHLFLSHAAPFLTMAGLGRRLVAATPPAVGRIAPDCELSTTQGKMVRLSEMAGKGAIVLIVLRGYLDHKCPFCNLQLYDFAHNAQAFVQIAARVVMVYPGSRRDLSAHAEKFMSDRNLPSNFDMLLDPDYKFTSLYGLRWNAPNETAYPSTFLIDRSGVIFFSKIVKGHGGGRTTAAEVLNELPRPSTRRYRSITP